MPGCEPAILRHECCLVPQHPELPFRCPAHVGAQPCDSMVPKEAI